jgi:hypothetical protein
MRPSAKLTLVFLLLRFVAITDGRSRSPIIRNGGSAAGRAGSRSKRHKRAAQPRSSSDSDSCRDDVGCFLFGMAVDLRRVR